jgi:hypothetical protein
VLVGWHLGCPVHIRILQKSLLKEGKNIMTNARDLDEGVILNEMAIEEIEEVIAPGFLLNE